MKNLLFAFFCIFASALLVKFSDGQLNGNSVLEKAKQNPWSNFVKILNVTRENVEGRSSDDEFDDSSRIIRVLSTFKYLRSKYLEFRSELKFVYCISDHFLKIDYLMDSIPTPRFFNKSIESDADEKYDRREQNSIDKSAKCSNSSDSTINQRLARDTRITVRKASTSLLSESISIGRSLLPIDGVPERFLVVIGGLVYLKRWIEDLVDSFGVLECTRRYLWVLFLRWIDA